MFDSIITLFHIRSPRMRTHAKQLMKFAVTGGLGSAVDISTLTFLVEFFNLSPFLAGICSSGIAVTVVFIINKFFTFRNHERKFAKQIAKFAIVYGMAFCMNIAFYSLLLHTGLHYIAAKLIAIGTIAMWNYYFSHTFVFKHS